MSGTVTSIIVLQNKQPAYFLKECKKNVVCLDVLDVHLIDRRFTLLLVRQRRSVRLVIVLLNFHIEPFLLKTKKK